MRLLVLFAFCLLTAATCKENRNGGVQNKDYTKSKDIVYIDEKRNHYITFSEIPDSLLSPAGKIHRKALNAVMENGVVVENNKLVMKKAKDEYLAKGMTEQTYYELVNNLKAYNAYFDSTGNDMVAEMIKDMKRGYKPDKSKK